MNISSFELHCRSQVNSPLSIVNYRRRNVFSRVCPITEGEGGTERLTNLCNRLLTRNTTTILEKNEPSKALLKSAIMLDFPMCLLRLESVAGKWSSVFFFHSWNFKVLLKFC